MKTKLLTLVTAGLAALATTAAAGDFTGPYAGVALSTHSGDQTYDGSSTPDYNMLGQTTGVFAGMNARSGQFAYGGEIAVHGGSVYEEDYDTPGLYYKDYRFTRFIDLKARAGVVNGSTFFYGVLGYSTANWDEDGEDYTAKGPVFGGGVEVSVTERAFAGVEFIVRNLDEDSFPMEATVRAVSVRGGLEF